MKHKFEDEMKQINKFNLKGTGTSINYIYWKNVGGDEGEVIIFYHPPDEEPSSKNQAPGAN